MTGSAVALQANYRSAPRWRPARSSGNTVRSSGECSLSGDALTIRKPPAAREAIMDALSQTLRVVRLVGAIFINARFDTAASAMWWAALVAQSGEKTNGPRRAACEPLMSRVTRKVPWPLRAIAESFFPGFRRHLRRSGCNAPGPWRRSGSERASTGCRRHAKLRSCCRWPPGR